MALSREEWAERQKRIRRSVWSGQPLSDPDEARQALAEIARYRRLRPMAIASFAVMIPIAAAQFLLWDDSLIRVLAVVYIALSVLGLAVVEPLLMRRYARAERANHAVVEAAED